MVRFKPIAGNGCELNYIFGAPRCKTEIPRGISETEISNEGGTSRTTVIDTVLVDRDGLRLLVSVLFGTSKSEGPAASLDSGGRTREARQRVPNNYRH
jgi:hypothetical protein